jgi:peptidoglycan/LPS O-acetylase OafA/YrhL
MSSSPLTRASTTTAAHVTRVGVTSADAEIDGGVRLGYRPELDGLRAMAVGVVVVYHLFTRLRGGFLGVDLFFVLSGFLITRLLLEQRHRDGRIGLGGFYLRRVARLLPALAAVAAVTLLVAAAGWGASVATAYRAVGYSLAYGMNWAHVFGALTPSAGVRPPLEHLWSLSVEEQFYVAWPLLLIGLLACGGTRWARRGATLVIAVCAVEVLVRFQQGVSFDVLYQGTDGQGAIFLLSGCLVAMVVATKPGDLARSTAGRAARIAVGPAVLVLAALVVAVPRESAFFYRGGFVVVAALLASIVVTALCGGALTRVLRIAPLAWLGRLSYGIYLWHVPLRDWITQADPTLDTKAVAGIVVVLTLGCAMASYHLVELPIRRWAARRLDADRPVREPVRGARAGEPVFGTALAAEAH